MKYYQNEIGNYVFGLNTISKLASTILWFPLNDSIIKYIPKEIYISLYSIFYYQSLRSLKIILNEIPTR